MYIFYFNQTLRQIIQIKIFKTLLQIFYRELYFTAE